MLVEVEPLRFPLDRGLQTIAENLEREDCQKQVDRRAAQPGAGPRRGRTPIAKRLANSDFIVEAASERLEIKIELLRDLDAMCRPEVLLSSKTSSISITKLAAMTGRPDKVIGMHFFNPRYGDEAGRADPRIGHLERDLRDGQSTRRKIRGENSR